MTTQLGTSNTPSATRVTKFTPGDKVLVVAKYPSYQNGWTDSWVSGMDAAVGKTGVVKSVDGLSVRVEIPGIPSNYHYPVFALSLVTEPKPQPAVINTPVKATPTFVVGQRVNVNYPNSPSWNGPAVVKTLNFGGSVSVEPEAGPQKGRIGAFSVTQLTPIVGQPRIAYGSTAALVTARIIAVELATKDGQVTADGVQEELQKRGINLGNAIGSVFTSNFVSTGRTVKSTRQGNRGRRILVWALPGTAVATGATPAPQPIVTPKYIIKYRFDSTGNEKSDWIRSGNKATHGEFTNLAEAQAAAMVEGKNQRMEYQVFNIDNTPVQPAPVAEAGPFIVQVTSKDHNGWERSWNKTIDGRKLHETEFATRAEAEQEATRNQSEMRTKNPTDNFAYRVVVKA